MSHSAARGTFRRKWPNRPKRRVMNTLAFRNSALARRSLRLRPIRRRPEQDAAEGRARDLLPQGPNDQRWVR
jgi:hypothetical protein